MVRTAGRPLRVTSNVSLSRWDDLLKQAYKIIDRVNRRRAILTDWSFGGGTALMLRIDHRESHDIDLFIDDPQLLPYLRSAIAETPSDIGEPSYDGDGAGHLKVAFEAVGEIDFIVSGHVTEHPFDEWDIFGRCVNLETVSEIIAKKIRYRGTRIQPRDIFDVAAACEVGYGDEISAALTHIPLSVSDTLATLDRIKPDYIETNIAQLMLKSGFKGVPFRALELTRDLLRQARSRR